MAIKDCHKWEELYASWSNIGGGVQSNVMHIDGAAPSLSSQSKRLRGMNNSKADAKCKGTLQAVMDMFKTFLAEKKVSSEKRDERKCQDKEEAVKG
jgi:hypothetical protein